jgi:exopolyphosphatase/guanosine-5'-triphosphate,3'-diphosphate pyrophosphatase
MKLKMTEYDSTRVNNQVLSKNWLQQTAQMLERSSLEQRQQLPGLEQGREDIIYPGIQMVILLLELLGFDSVRVSDAGLLEGLLLS